MKRHLLNEKFVTIEQLADGGYAHKLPGVTVEYSFAEISGRNVGCIYAQRCMLYGICNRKQRCFID